MDFRNRNEQPLSTGRTTASAAGAGSSNSVVSKEKKHPMRDTSPRWLRVLYIILLFSLTGLCIAVAYFMSTLNPNESKYVMTKKYQAVFLSNGQVYFGQIQSVNGRYVDLRNIFYLNSQNGNGNSNSQSTSTSSNSTNNQFTLVKLGCELHGPYDQMIINRGTITFWENLRDDSQVVKTIKQWQQQNPNGQTCQTSSNSTNQAASSSNNGSSTASETKKQ